MSFNMDTGPGGAEGPWISWSARGTQDGVIPAKSFFLRDNDQKTVLDAFNTGVVFDIDNMKTGWQKSDGIAGQAPDWKWNPTISQFAPSPGDDYKKGFEIRVAIGGGQTATWQQAGAGAWNAFVGIVPALQQQPAGKLPVIRMTSTKAVQFKRGSTVEPVLEVVQWVDRPDCLKDEAPSIATDTAPAQAAQATPPAQASIPAEAQF